MAGSSGFYIGLEWTPPTGVDFDVDASVFACTHDANDDPKLFRDDYFVCYAQAEKQGAPFASKDNAICHSGDNLTGIDTDDNDDEQIRIYPDRLDPQTKELSIIASIYEAKERGDQNFGQAKKLSIRICDMDDQGNPTTERYKFKLNEDYSQYSVLQFGSIYLRDDGDWAFNPTGAGFANADLGAVWNIYK